METENFTIDWSKMKVYEQSETGIKIDSLDKTAEDFNKGFHGLNHKQFDILVKTDPPVTNDSIMAPAYAPGMISNFYSAVTENYEKPLQMKETVLKEIFKNVNEAYIFLGEIQDKGLVFMWEDSKEAQYYIVSDCSSKISITEQDFLNHKEFYAENLKATLDTYIPKGDPNPGNTKRFIVKDRVYQEFLLQSATDTSSTFAVTFYPAMHVIQDLYCNRLTFIMVVEKYVNNKWEPIENTALYDRNGLCPPGNC